MELRSIQPTAQQVAEAIAAAIKVEVEIADSTLLRIAGTGLYRNRILQTLSQDGYAYQEVLRTGLPLVLPNSGHHPVCEPCRHFGNCRELAEVSVPIEYQGKMCGVIGLVAADPAQKRRLLADVGPLLQFLTKMADLLTTKLREQAVIRERVAAASQLEMVMNYLDRGVIALTEDGIMTHVNEAAARIFGGRILTGEPLSSLVTGLALDPSNTSPVQTTVRWRRGNQRQTLLFTVTPIRRDDRCLGMVVTIEDESQVAKVLTSFANQALPYGLDSILGESRAIDQIKAVLPQIAQGEATVLIQGESGTGKELIAQAIHTLSRRSAGPFIAVNCAAIPETLLESELFGYEAGAFTGARQGGKIGKFQLADGGTLFLDEVGDLPLHLQAKLLRVLQERYLERLGGTTRIPVNVRVLAATNRSLESMIGSGEFREDLYYRLNVIPLQIPPLRERPEDITPLAWHFLRMHAARSSREIKDFSPASLQCLERYPWPGNIRELANAVEYAVTMEEGTHVAAESLPPKLRVEPEAAVSPPEETLNLRELERRAYLAALCKVQARLQPKERAADLLGVSRATFFRKLREYGPE